MIDYEALEEHLTDFFARQHHHPQTARKRARSVVEIVRQHHTEPEAAS